MYHGNISKGCIQSNKEANVAVINSITIFYTGSGGGAYAAPLFYHLLVHVMAWKVDIFEGDV